MRRIIILLALMTLLFATTAQAQEGGISVTCPDGREITNGVEVVINMRPGFTLTATALGVGDFDPVIAVADRDVVRACSDDSDRTRDYAVDLPTTGLVTANARSAQLPFSHNYGDFENISLIIGGFQGASGEFVLVIEGMAVTALDGEGDPFFLRVTENMTTADVNAAVYMMATTQQLDPFIREVDADGNDLITCDDAGTDFCQDELAVSLETAYVQRPNNRRTPPSRFNSMLVLPILSFTDLDFSLDNFFNFFMTTYEQRSTGDYVVAFHIGIGEPGASGSKLTPGGDDNSGETPQGDKLTPSADPNAGVNVTCPDGTEIVNGVEVVINMRPGFTYTATALGIDGYDPVIALADAGVIRACENDSLSASSYEADLPSTGVINGSGRNAQMPFNHNYSGFADISLIIGDASGSSGQFLLILDGMAVTAADGDGDPFSVRLTPNIGGADVDMSVYMLATERTLDPLIRLIDADRNTVLSCDDAGNDDICEPGSSSLGGSFVSRASNARTPSGNTNAMLVVPTTQLTADEFTGDLFLNFLMTSFDGATGQYVVAFHIGTGNTPPAGSI
ncbi:MAG: hypothetical protein OHK0046_44420 [Anaerolineae bacterium]